MGAGIGSDIAQVGSLHQCRLRIRRLVAFEVQNPNADREIHGVGARKGEGLHLGSERHGGPALRSRHLTPLSAQDPQGSLWLFYRDERSVGVLDEASCGVLSLRAKRRFQRLPNKNCHRGRSRLPISACPTCSTERGYFAPPPLRHPRFSHAQCFFTSVVANFEPMMACTASRDAINGRNKLCIRQNNALYGVQIFASNCIYSIGETALSGWNGLLIAYRLTLRNTLLSRPRPRRGVT